MTTASKINLIDLAGSERASQVLNDQVIKTAEIASLRLKVTTVKFRSEFVSQTNSTVKFICEPAPKSLFQTPNEVSDYMYMYSNFVEGLEQRFWSWFADGFNGWIRLLAVRLFSLHVDCLFLSQNHERSLGQGFGMGRDWRETRVWRAWEEEQTVDSSVVF